MAPFRVLCKAIETCNYLEFNKTTKELIQAKIKKSTKLLKGKVSKAVKS